jgi:hypothetical protein
MIPHPPPTPPVIGGHPARHSGEHNHPVTRVVIHSAVMACKPGAARQLAAWNRTGLTGGSWHYAVDPDETIQCSFDRYVCHHAPPNDGSIAIEMADDPSLGPARWLLPRQRRMLRRTARLTAELCLAYELPLALLTPAGLRADREGIATHNSVSEAFGQSSHWDPGTWPAKRFLRLVRRYAAELQTPEGVNK